MRNHEQNDAEKLGYETFSVNGRTIANGFVLLFGVMFGALLLMAGLTFVLTKWDGGEATVEAPDPVATPPGVPTLDSNQRDGLRAPRAKESQVLTEYAWVDANTGVARIPIKRAMEIMSQRSAPNQEPRQ